MRINFEEVAVSLDLVSREGVEYIFELGDSIMSMSQEDQKCYEMIEKINGVEFAIAHGDDLPHALVVNADEDYSVEDFDRLRSFIKIFNGENCYR